jgi:hypothetical protein
MTDDDWEKRDYHDVSEMKKIQAHEQLCALAKKVAKEEFELDIGDDGAELLATKAEIAWREWNRAAKVLIDACEETGLTQTAVDYIVKKVMKLLKSW